MTVSPTQLNNYIKAFFDTDEILLKVSVKGEVTNLKESHGNLFFSLKDEFSQIECFAYDAAEKNLCDGLIVEVSGNVNFKPNTSRVSFFVREVKLLDDVGLEYARFLKLKEALQKEGLFDEAHKKPIPKFNCTIGVVTSASGAVRKDIEDVVLRRQPSAEMLLYPVHVQGTSAESEIVEAIKFFCKSNVDVVILARGGGSNEDLSVFNSEKIVRAVYNCSKPVVSAIGHGTDFTLTDFVADKRAVTPSEAAEIVSFDASHLISSVNSLLEKSFAAAKRKYYFSQQTVESAVNRSLSTLSNRLSKSHFEIFEALAQIETNNSKKLQSKQFSVEREINRLSSNNPTNVLKRGFALTFKNGQRVKSVKDLSIGQQLDVKFFDGEAVTQIKEIRSKK